MHAESSPVAKISSKNSFLARIYGHFSMIHMWLAHLMDFLQLWFNQRITSVYPQLSCQRVVRKDPFCYYYYYF